jgi:hypothetical protein
MIFDRRFSRRVAHTAPIKKLIHKYSIKKESYTDEHLSIANDLKIEERSSEIVIKVYILATIIIY